MKILKLLAISLGCPAPITAMQPPCNALAIAYTFDDQAKKLMPQKVGDTPSTSSITHDDIQNGKAIIKKEIDWVQGLKKDLGVATEQTDTSDPDIEKYILWINDLETLQHSLGEHPKSAKSIQDDIYRIRDQYSPQEED